MALAAAERCLKASGIDRKRIDLLVLGTLSPDYLLPATATAVQNRLGLNCPAMDVSAACAGFLYAMVTGMQYVATGCSEYAFVIGADTNSRVMNPDDKKTYPLFGDGAGAVLITRGSSEQGMLSYTLGADGSGEKLLVRLGGGSRKPLVNGQCPAADWFVRMDGRPVFKWAVRLLEDSSRQVFGRCRLHNRRRKTLGLPPGEYPHFGRGRRRPWHRPPELRNTHRPLRKHLGGQRTDCAR